MFISTPVRGTTATTHERTPVLSLCIPIVLYSLTDGGLHKMFL